MKQDFVFYNPTKIYFGEHSLDNLKDELSHYGQNILLAYGGGSIKKIGLYDEVIKILKSCDKHIVELANIMPNPTYKKLMEGVNLVHEYHIDLILAVGGGSVIDLAKGVSVSAYCKDDAWKKYWIKGEPLDNYIVPVGSILTMVGTGSEMNGGSVITNVAQKLKVGRVFGPEAYPKFSILNPTYTYSVSQYQMVSGIFDIMSHLMEQYFSDDDDNVSDYLIESLLKCLIKQTPVAIQNPTNYEARSNIMWTATLALNTLVGKGKTQDWLVHAIEHQLGAYTNCAHGMGLAAISIPYYRHIYSYGLPKFKRFAIEVFNVNPSGLNDEEIALKGLRRLTKFIKNSNMVTSLKELGATKEMLHDIAYSVNNSGYGYKQLDHEEILQILEECYE